MEQPALIYIYDSNLNIHFFYYLKLETSISNKHGRPHRTQRKAPQKTWEESSNLSCAPKNSSGREGG